MVNERDERLAALLAVDAAPDAAFAVRAAARIRRVKPSRALQRRRAMLLVVLAAATVSLIGASVAQHVIVAMTPPGQGAYPSMTAWAPLALLGGFLGPLVHVLLTRIAAL